MSDVEIESFHESDTEHDLVANPNKNIHVDEFSKEIMQHSGYSADLKRSSSVFDDEQSQQGIQSSGDEPTENDSESDETELSDEDLNSNTELTSEQTLLSDTDTPSLKMTDEMENNHQLSTIDSLTGFSEETDPLTSTVFPLSRIKKIVKLDPEAFNTSNISLELIGLATESFLKSLSFNSLQFAKNSKRKTLMKNDISQAIERSPQFSFLTGTCNSHVILDIFPKSLNF